RARRPGRSPGRRCAAACGARKGASRPARGSGPASSMPCECATASCCSCSSGLLGFLPEDLLVGILHALALVGFGRTEAADVGRQLTDLALVRPADDDLRLA